MKIDSQEVVKVPRIAVVIAGPNGSGKTTFVEELLRSVLGKPLVRRAHLTKICMFPLRTADPLTVEVAMGTDCWTL